MFNCNKKITFVKSKFGLCAYFDDSLFDKDKHQKLIAILKLFELDNLKTECRFIAHKESKLFKKTIVLNNTRTEMVKKNKVCTYEKVIITTIGSDIYEMLENFLQNEEFVEIEFFENDNSIVYLGINDNDGSYIIFNTKRYDKNKIVNDIKSCFDLL